MGGFRDTQTEKKKNKKKNKKEKRTIKGNVMSQAMSSGAGHSDRLQPWHRGERTLRGTYRGGHRNTCINLN